nr:MAG TPA: hypothetical protein [Caudoviricetes sp.]
MLLYIMEKFTSTLIEIRLMPHCMNLCIYLLVL